MIKKILSLGIAAMSLMGINAQMPQLTPLPLNPKVKSGVLSNGLSYYILHNEEPKERANFYIAQKVGSTLETQEQLGLAHFLEHMAFNGTKHYPGKSMLNYLQSKGIRFGADINAYTDFDETVYNINNVPTTDSNLMDSVLLVLSDWSGSILLEESEINAERGVIQEEWRSRNDANFRMICSILPKIYEEYQYEQTPIGKMEVVMNFKPEELRAYYKKWYRPDQQGIVIVGDFDADVMEAKVKDLFSKIPMPENAAERVYPKVSNNEKPIYATYSDPELTAARTTISFKSDVVPFEMRNTVEMYVNEGIVKQLVTSLFSHRVSEHVLSPDCKFAQAGVYFGSFYVSKTKDSFNVVVIPKGGDMQEAVADMMSLVARACKTGFTESELQRVKDEMLASYEKAFNERDKRSNDAYGAELYRFFIDNEPAPGIEKEYEIAKQILGMIPLQAINMGIQGLLTPNNMVIVSSVPEKEGFEILSEEIMTTTVKDAMNAEYEAFVDETVTDPLIAKLPKPGKIKSQINNKKFDTTDFVLSNGVKVVVKTTDFAADEISLTAFRKGGKQVYGNSQAPEVLMSGVASGTAKMGPFDNKTLSKYLAGKKVEISYGINNYTDIISGNSTIKDLPVMMELLYTLFTNLGNDETTYNITKERIINNLKNLENNPQVVFGKKINEIKFPGNLLSRNVDVETVEKANYDEMMNMVRANLSNAADYIFVFVGNINVDTLKPLLEQYVSTLPSKNVSEPKVITSFIPARGVLTDDTKIKMQTPVTSVYDYYSGNNVAFNLKNYIMVGMVGDLLEENYVRTLREEESGTYGAGVGASLNFMDGLWSLVYQFQTNSEMKDRLVNRANDELINLLNNGAPEVDFNKVKEAMIKQYEINVRKNGYWMNGITTDLRGYDLVTDYLPTLQGITLQELNEFMKSLYDGKNRIEVILEGVAE